MDEKFTPIRRQDRLLDDGRAYELLENSLYGFLSLGEDGNGYNYGVPMSYAWDPGEQCLWFHCAPEGVKLDCLRLNPDVSFCVVGGVETVPEKFTTRYESVIAFGRAEIASADEERRAACRRIVAKYCPGHEAIGETYMERSLPRTLAFRIRIDHISAKSKK